MPLRRNKAGVHSVRPKTRNDPPHRIGVFVASEQKFDRLRQKGSKHDGDEQRHDAADVENRAPPHGRNEIRVQQAAGQAAERKRRPHDRH
jgi:hypothetical protein